ncbi:hypothetical protein HGB07_07020 [Candidatus Roizmanbacteria bacterium]|nr:hypothetical protein [Candidatus Roizmanbacteria bacterium]
MVKYTVIRATATTIFGLVIGILLGLAYQLMPLFVTNNQYISPLSQFQTSEYQVIGFLPYWLVDSATTDYSPYLTTLAYFGVTVGSDGKIVKMNNEREANLGWHLLATGKLDGLLSKAKAKGETLSLVAFNGVNDSIGELINDPVVHARNLLDEVVPVMKQYGFKDLNLDIESTTEASQEARLHFTQFVAEVKRGLDAQKAGTLTIDVSPIVLVKNYLIDVKAIAPYVDTVVFMTYDYHYQGSYVTGPVAPLGGGGTISEFDTIQAIHEAETILPIEKIVMGIPLYGYEWETIGNTARSAVIPGTGIVATNKRVEELLKTCTTCSVRQEPEAKERYLIYEDEDTGSYHQIFYPEKEGLEAKVSFASHEHLSGVALWALGYEGHDILKPIQTYRK